MHYSDSSLAVKIKSFAVSARFAGAKNGQA